MRNEFRVSVAYFGDLRSVHDYTVNAGDARVAAQKAMKLFAKAPRWKCRMYDDLPLRPGQALTIVVSR